MDHLREHGIPVPEARTAGSHGGFVYEIQELGIGEDLYQSTFSWSPYQPLHPGEAGVMLARLHTSAEALPGPGPALASVEIRLLDFRLDRSDRGDRADRRPAAAARRLPGGARLALRRRAAHAPVPSAPGAVPRRTRAAVDPQRLAWHELVVAGRRAHPGAHLGPRLRPRRPHHRRLRPGDRDREVRGGLGRSARRRPRERPRAPTSVIPPRLHRIRPVSGAEFFALPLLFPLCHAEYQLSEIDYFLSVVPGGSEKNAEIAYRDWFLGHTKWQKSEEGQAFLGLLGGDGRS